MKICNTRGFEVLACNCLHLPYRDGVFDAAVCIAVIHHLSTEVRVGIIDYFILVMWYLNTVHV